MVFHIVTIKPRGLMLAGEFEEGAEGLQQLPSAFAHPLYLLRSFRFRCLLVQGQAKIK
jgi:hypothetical protein